MTTHSFDVCGIGNALVDIIADATDVFLQQQGIAKGGMTLIDTPRAEALYSLLKSPVEMSGGSAGNTVAGIASLGGTASFMGKVRNDALGAVYRGDMERQGVFFATKPAANGSPTGQCIIFVTPDAQRSMNTYLGAAVDFQLDDIDPEVIKASQVTYMEGFLFDSPEAKKAFRHAAQIAHSAGRKISITLSDTFCVNRHRDDFLSFIRDDVDILFANEAELIALNQSTNFETALTAARALCDIVVATRSDKGAVIAEGAQTVQAPAAPVTKVVDTTGAGDLYAAGFLFGVTHGKTLVEAGKIGAIAAAEVISHYGPRPQKKLAELI